MYLVSFKSIVSRVRSVCAARSSYKGSFLASEAPLYAKKLTPYSLNLLRSPNLVPIGQLRVARESVIGGVLTTLESIHLGLYMYPIILYYCEISLLTGV